MSNDMTRQEKLHDEKIIQQIFSKLNVNNFNENICTKNSWYGYKQNDIYQVIDFRDEAIKKCSSLINNDIKAGLNITIEKLTDFLDFSARKMFLEKDEYVLIKDEIRYEQSEKDSVIINEKAQKAYDYVNKFIVFLNKIEINYKNNQVLGFRR